MEWILGNDKRTSLWFHKWMSNGKTLREQIHGPLEKNDHLATVSKILADQNSLNLQSLSFDLPKHILHKITSIYRSPNKNDTTMWKSSKKESLQHPQHISF